MTDLASEPEAIRAAVQERYGRAAREATMSCCGPTPVDVPFGIGLYDDAERDAIPAAAAAASLGCGNPTALAQLAPGEVVLDLGSGGGIDVLLSARRVAPDGMAYGLDMTPEMHALALRNQAETAITNAEFLIGTIENIPLPDECVDVIISNCVVNLSADKHAVFREAFRVLRPTGRLAISDIVLRRPLPSAVAGLVAAWTGCIAGAMLESDLREALTQAGFVDSSIETTMVYDRTQLLSMAAALDPAQIPHDLDVEAALEALEGAVTSAFIRGTKPA